MPGLYEHGLTRSSDPIHTILGPQGHRIRTSKDPAPDIQNRSKDMQDHIIPGMLRQSRMRSRCFSAVVLYFHIFSFIHQIYFLMFPVCGLLPVHRITGSLAKAALAQDHSLPGPACKEQLTISSEPPDHRPTGAGDCMHKTAGCQVKILVTVFLASKDRRITVSGNAILVRLCQSTNRINKDECRG
jgi:hypothetical protein